MRFATKLTSEGVAQNIDDLIRGAAKRGDDWPSFTITIDIERDRKTPDSYIVALKTAFHTALG